MGTILAKSDSGTQCFARLKLDSGEQVLISIAQSGVRIFKMKWAGLAPAATLWESKSLAEIAQKFFDSEKPHLRPLDSLIARIIDCHSTAQVVARLAGQ